jgi:ELWxxDGT repeat protein
MQGCAGHHAGPEVTMQRILLAVPFGLVASLAAQVVLLKDVNPGFSGSGPTAFTELNGQRYFAASNGFQTGIYRTDGTPQGTVLGVDPVVIGADINAEHMTAAAGRLWFASSVFDPIHGAEPWISDGTNAGTRIVADLEPGSASSSPRYFTDLGDRCAFLADTGQFSGPSLVISDGTAGGTRAVAAAANPSPGSHRAVAIAGKVLFTGQDAANGSELWAYDLATSTASLVKDILPGAASSDPWLAGVAHDRAWFHALTPGGFRVRGSVRSNRIDSVVLIGAVPADVPSLVKTPSYVLSFRAARWFSEIRNNLRRVVLRSCRRHSLTPRTPRSPRSARTSPREPRGARRWR